MTERLGSFASESTATLSPQEHLISELDRLEYSHRAAAERSAETVGDAAMRQQQAEEKAILLRDGALMESGEHYKTKLGRGLSDEGLQKHQRENTLASALTAKNIEILAAVDRAEGRLLEARRGARSDESMVVAVLGDLGREPADARVPRKTAPG